MIDKLSESSPLTYDKINQIIVGLNNLESRIVDVDRSSYPFIDVILNSNNVSNNVNRRNGNNLTPVQITAGTKSITVETNKSVYTGDVTLSPQFNSNPIVICSLSVDNDSGINPQITISGIKQNIFKFKIKLDQNPTNSTKSMSLNYIAIGYDTP